MATTPVGLPTETGLTGLLLKLFDESDLTTVVNNSGSGDSMAYEGSTGLAIAEIDEALTGRHYATVEDGGGDVWAEGWVTLADTTDFHEIGGYAYLPTVESQVSGISGKLPSRSKLVGTTNADGSILAADKTGYALSAAGVDAIWDEATSGHTTAGTFAKLLTDLLAIFAGITTLAGWLRLLARKDSTVATTHAAELAEINSIGGNYSNTADSLEATGDVVDTINNAVATGTITVVSHQAPNSRIVLVQGDSYENDNGRYLRWVNATGAEWPDDLTGATITFTAIRKTESGAVGAVDADKKIVATGTVETATAPNQEVRCQLLPADTNKEVGLYGYDVEAKIGDVVHTLVTTEVDSATLLQESRKARDARSLEILRQYAEASS